MRRIVLACGLLAIGWLSLTVAAQRGGQDQPKVVEVDKIKDNLYVLKGGGGNTAVFLTSNGVAVVDTKNPGWGPPLLEKIKSITNKPITTIINTHTHGDHTSGQMEFAGVTAEVVTHDNTKANMAKLEPYKKQITTVATVIGAIVVMVSPAGPIILAGAAIYGVIQGIQ